MKFVKLKFKHMFVSICDFLSKCAKYNHTFFPASNKKGENNGKSILKAEDVLEIRRLCRTENKSYAELARRFNISPTTIGDIVRRRTWTHL